MSDDPTAETERLRRQLRAMSAVTSQLHAQLRAAQPVSQAKPRRAGQADAWIGELERVALPVQVEVLVTTDRKVWLREGSIRRSVKAGVLTIALERIFGPRRPVEQAELDGLTEGPPVEVFESPSGPMFIVVGGERLPLRGLPAPIPVSQEASGRFPEGPELDVWFAVKSQLDKAQAVVAPPTAKGGLARRVARGGKRRLKRLITTAGG